MKLQVIKDLSFAETLINIYTAHIDRRTQDIIDFIKNDNGYILATKHKKVYLLNPSDIIRIYTESKHLALETSDDLYTTKHRLYQLEEKLPHYFVKISQGEIANIKQIKKLDLNFKGTIQVTFKTGKTSFVSRRSIKKVKEALGL